MSDEYDDEIASAREWLGLDQDVPSTIGATAWMLVKMLGISAVVLVGMMLVGGI